MSKISLINGSCADQEVDVIVNAANRYLMSGGGICGVIFRKAGYTELGEACQKIKTPLDDGEAVLTPAFNIKNAKYIIHAIGPDFNMTPDAIDKLFYAYYNSMKLLIENGLHSISFPLISAGIFGGNLENPARESATQCIKAYKKIVEEYDNYDIYVTLCAYTSTEYNNANMVL